MSIRILTVAALAAALAGAAGYWLGRGGDHPHAAGGTQEAREVLYWYDPMYPQQRFDQPGPSPFMDMQLVPRYAQDEVREQALQIDPRVAQNLGVRLARVERGPLAEVVEAQGSLALSGREVAVVQARVGGFVERVYRHAPGDVIAAGTPLVELLVPDWAVAQEEYLALRRSGHADLAAAARRRLQLAGMPEDAIRALQRNGEVQVRQRISAPLGGLLQSLDVREGMTLAAGAALARINGLERIWLEVAVPEAQAGAIRVGQAVEVSLPARPGERLEGRVDALLAEADAQSRTLRVRIELPNPDASLRAGLSAQVRFVVADSGPVLRLPSEALIRTGRRTLVMLAEGEGRYRPQEVRLGRSDAHYSEVLEGLQDGQQVVASGQFLLDSEASLRGLGLGEPAEPAAAAPLLHESSGRLVAIDGHSLKIAHGPFPTLGMPGMTMRFEVARHELLQGLEVGQRLRFAVRESDAGLLIERIAIEEQTP